MVRKPRLFRGTDKSVWKFYTEGVSSSLLSKFLTCREQARLHLVEGLRSRTEPLYLALGTSGHWMLHQFYEKKKPPTNKRILKLLGSYKEAWLAEVPRPTNAMLEQQDTVYGLLKILLPAYCQRWSGDWKLGKAYPFSTDTVCPSNWQALEGAFTTDWEYADGVKVPIRGQWDGVFLAGKRKRYWCFDSKFLSVISPDDIEETMAYNLQFMLYLWAMRKLTGQLPNGFLMNVCRRPTHRLGKYENKPDFFARVAKDIEARPDHFFQRYELRINTEDLKTFEENVLSPLMDDVRGWWDGTVPHYLNPTALVSKYGRCEMFLPITQGNFAHTYRVKSVFGYATSLFGG